MDEELKDALLRSIALTGSADSEIALVKPIIAKAPGNLISVSSGLPRISYHYLNRFKLLLSTPETLKAMNPFEIRCCLCKSVISYPAWHYDVRFNVNWFHYFVCFDKANGSKVTARCFRR